jgi:hypothetical protein
MGKINLLTASYDGKLGATVGAPWKALHTVRTYRKPKYTDYPDQLKIRAIFGGMTSFVARFSQQLAILSSLPLRAQSVRNAIIKINKAQFSGTTFDKTTLLVNRGGLPGPTAVTANATKSANTCVINWTAAVSSIITTKAKVVGIVCDVTNDQAWVQAELNSAGTMTIPIQTDTGHALDVYVYLIDYRGSARVGSLSQYQTVTVA